MKSRNKTLSKIIVGLLAGISIIRAAHGQDINGSMTFEGKTRTYLLHIPPVYNEENPIPLILAFHNMNGTGAKMAEISGFSPMADQENFIVVYPEGWMKKWASPGGSVNDVGFISALIDVLSTDYNIDVNRIYAAGVSMGGMFTYRLGLELSGVFASIASVGGYMPGYAPNPTPVPSRAISAVHFHGTTDPTIPYEKAESAVDFWVDNNNCSTTPVIVSLPNTDPTDGTTVDQITYGGCTANTEVKLYKIYNGGHTWPGTTSNAMPGTVCKDISASNIIWDFFTEHPLNAMPAVSFTKPKPNASFTAPALVKMKATATDADGSITKVEFFNGAQKLKTDMTSPYNYNWKNVAAGTYLLRAVATDNLGGVTEDSVTVTVDPQKIIPETTATPSLHVFYDLGGQQLRINKLTNEVVYDLFIYDVRGNKIFSIQNIGDLAKIVSANSFTPGMYFYSIRTNDNDVVAGKFIVIQ